MTELSLDPGPGRSHRPPRHLADLTMAQRQAIATEAAAFAAAMIGLTPGANTAALQVIIAALK